MERQVAEAGSRLKPPDISKKIAKGNARDSSRLSICPILHLAESGVVSRLHGY